MIPILMLVVTGAVTNVGTACHAVNSDRIRSGDLAAVSPDFAGLPPETAIGYAPQPGGRRTLEPAELLRIAAANNLEVTHTLASVCFERVLMPLDAAKILAALRTSLNRPDSEIEVLEFSNISSPLARSSSLSNRCRHMPQPTQPSGTDTSTSKAATIQYGPAPASQCPRPGWSRPLSCAPARPSLPPICASKKTRDYPSKADPLKSIADALNHVARRFLDTGTPITTADLMDANDVDRGDTVTVEVQSGGTVLLLPAQADMSGRRGQIIPLRNAASGKVFRALITGKDKALLDFQSPETYK